MHHTDRDYVLLSLIIYTFVFVMLSLCFSRIVEPKTKTLMCYITVFMVAGIPFIAYCLSRIWKPLRNIIPCHLAMCVLIIFICMMILLYRIM